MNVRLILLAVFALTRATVVPKLLAVAGVAVPIYIAKKFSVYPKIFALRAGIGATGLSIAGAQYLRSKNALQHSRAPPSSYMNLPRPTPVSYQSTLQALQGGSPPGTYNSMPLVYQVPYPIQSQLPGQVLQTHANIYQNQMQPSIVNARFTNMP